MKVELIPLLEITNHGQDLEFPAHGSSLSNPGGWDNYHQRSNAAAGFPDQMEPYLPGRAFYLLDKVSDANLLLIMKRELAELETMRGEYPEQEPQACVLEGGYLLRVNGQDVLFPQCCCDLADIETWQNLAHGKWDTLFAGHPSPIITINENKLCFDLTRGDSGELFSPTPPVTETTIERETLVKAVDEVLKTLKEFGQRLERIAANANIDTKDIQRIFIYDFTWEGE